jgi:hypothetical protein
MSEDYTGKLVKKIWGWHGLFALDRGSQIPLEITAAGRLPQDSRRTAPASLSSSKREMMGKPTKSHKCLSFRNSLSLYGCIIYILLYIILYIYILLYIYYYAIYIYYFVLYIYIYYYICFYTMYIYIIYIYLHYI